MKKILTFLVMMLFTAGIVSAQVNNANGELVDVLDGTVSNNVQGGTSDGTPVATPVTAKFNYQAVVRDNNDHNLVMNKACKVTISIYEADNNTPVYTEVLEGTTNRNGMFSHIIGEKPEAGSKAINTIQWNSAFISASFNVNGTNVATVQTPVMAVPYALQADNAPIKITTEQICNYLKDQNVGKAQLDSIIEAVVLNPNGLKQDLKDTVYNYIKQHPSDVKEIGIYFLQQVRPEDLDDANAAVSQDVKNHVKELAKQYIKDNKAAAMEVLASYISQAEKDDIDTILKHVKNNRDAFDTILAIVVDSSFEYVKTHKEKFLPIIKYWFQSATPSDVQTAYNELKTTPVYDFMYGKFTDYVYYYLTEKFYAVSDSCAKTNPDVDFRIDLCKMRKDVDHLMGLANDMDATCQSVTMTAGTGVNSSLKDADHIVAKWVVTNPNNISFTVDNLSLTIMALDATTSEYEPITPTGSFSINTSEGQTIITFTSTSQLEGPNTWYRLTPTLTIGDCHKDGATIEL